MSLRSRTLGSHPIFSLLWVSRQKPDCGTRRACLVVMSDFITCIAPELWYLKSL